MVEKFDDIANVAFNFYKNLLGSNHLVDITDVSTIIQRKLDSPQKDSMAELVSDSEIRVALFSISNEKAPASFASPHTPPCRSFYFSTSIDRPGAGDDSLNSFSSLENQFKGFRTQLEESGSLRYKIKTVVMDIESTTQILEETNVQIGTLRELYKQLAEIVWEVPGQYYNLQVRYNGEWRSETQSVV
ncbi:hypothetical protein LINPERPRIM_LOCUS35458 [Linum perenne]